MSCIRTEIALASIRDDITTSQARRLVGKLDNGADADAVGSELDFYRNETNVARAVGPGV